MQQDLAFAFFRDQGSATSVRLRQIFEAEASTNVVHHSQHRSSPKRNPYIGYSDEFLRRDQRSLEEPGLFHLFQRRPAWLRLRADALNKSLHLSQPPWPALHHLYRFDRYRSSFSSFVVGFATATIGALKSPVTLFGRAKQGDDQ